MAMEDTDSSAFGVQLRGLRIAAGLTQEMLAERSGVSVAAISALESGRRRRPHPPTVSMLAEGLGLGADERGRLAAMAQLARRRPLAVPVTQDDSKSPQQSLRPGQSAVSNEGSDRRIVSLARAGVHSALGGAPVRWGGVVARRWLAAVAGLATLVAALAVATTVQPDWCLPAICTQPSDPHDQFLEADLTALQASSYVLAADPDSYSMARLPATSGSAAMVAQRVGPTVPFRVVIRVHDVRRNGTSMFIETVTLMLRQVSSVPTPLRVWERGSALDYGNNPYMAVYHGQARGVSLLARYAGIVPTAHVQLQPGESDELAVQVASSMPVQLEFQAQITYRIGSELQVRSLLLPYTFRVTYSDEMNWQPYQLREGHFVAV
jgi:transcriptional regulator with XRE-family HTH domain